MITKRCLLFLTIVASTISTITFAQGTAKLIEKDASSIDVAAYFWPSLQNEARSRETLWSDGMGEWQVITQCEPRFEGHYQPRQPLGGYTLDDDPAVMELQIKEATDHGVNVFILVNLIITQ